MPSIDDSIRKIDLVICRYLDNIDNCSRGAISQDILEQLIKLVNHALLKYCHKDSHIDFNEKDLSLAIEYAQVNSKLKSIYKFRLFLQTVTSQFTLDEDGSERLMLKYYKYLLEIKNLLNKDFGIKILHNLSKFPLNLDRTLQEYYLRISEKIEKYPIKTIVNSDNKYYIQKLKPIFVNTTIYYEVTFAPVSDKKYKSKSNRVIAFTRLPIISNYACKFHIVQDTIKILDNTMPISIIDAWEVSIRDCEFQNFIALIRGKKLKVSYQEQHIICQFITKSQYTLTDLMDFSDGAYYKITTDLEKSLKSPIFLPILDLCRKIIKKETHGQNILRYLLYNMNNVIIRNQYDTNPNNNLSQLYISNKAKPFDDLPFNRSPIGHNPKLSALYDCIPLNKRKHEVFARHIKNNTEGKGQLFTALETLNGFGDISKLIKKYNDSLWFGHKPRSNLIFEHNQVFINEYLIDTCNIIKKLNDLSSVGIENYHNYVSIWLMLGLYEIDCQEKEHIITHIFDKSRVGVIYGSAGVGKSTFINHLSHYFNNSTKLYLAQTNPAKENLIRKVYTDNATFSTIASFLSPKNNNTIYDLLVIDECSTISNRDMIAILEKAQFEMLLLVGDTYQIDAIQFGNWFSALKSFLPEYAVFELQTPHRTHNKYLLELWDSVRYMGETTKEIIAKESYSLNVDSSLLSPPEKDEAILCLNYDGLYGINNINRFLQESNPNPAVFWDIHQYKINDPILFLETDRFFPIIYNNMKGIIRRIEILNKDSQEECIQFDIEIPREVSIEQSFFHNLQLVDYYEELGTSLIRFNVYKLKSADEDGNDLDTLTIVPFQIAYAVSIHKAQGLEYNSIKIVITDEVEDLVTHNIFYTAITRTKEKLKIYWSPEVEEKLLKRIKPRDINNDVEILKKYLCIKNR